jgi:Zn-dependent protease with chaperone function
MLKALSKGYFNLIHPLVQQDQRPATFRQIATGWAFLLLPGVIVMTVIWLWLRALFLRAGVGGALLALGARAPSALDFEEQQLVNVVAEMAIAAGLPAPKVVLLDSAAPNLAAVGTGPDDATVIVSRRMLDEFDRDQTQAALGHVVGSIGNGDLRIAFAIVSVYQTFGLLMTLLDLPFSRTARATIGRALRLALRRTADNGDGEADKVTALFSEAFQSTRLDEIGQFIEPDPTSRLGRLDERTVIFRGIRIAALMPLLFANLFGKIVLLVLMPLVLGPLIALLWRTRRYMADSTAVKLTRNPDGMTGALAALGEKGGLPPGSRWSAHLFMVGTEVAQEQARRRMMATLKGGDPAQAAKPLSERLSAGIGTAGEAMRQASEAEAAEAGTFAEANLIFMNFHPLVRKRLERLRAQGGTAGV